MRAILRIVASMVVVVLYEEKMQTRKDKIQSDNSNNTKHSSTLCAGDDGASRGAQQSFFRLSTLKFQIPSKMSKRDIEKTLY
jgi:hypothetical protein